MLDGVMPPWSFLTALSVIYVPIDIVRLSGAASS